MTACRRTSGTPPGRHCDPLTPEAGPRSGATITLDGPLRYTAAVNDLVRDLEVLLTAHHALILLETEDDARAHAMVSAAAARRRVPHYVWRVHRGLCLDDRPETAIPRTIAPHHCLEYILGQTRPAVYEMQRLSEFTAMPVTIELLKDLHARLSKSVGALFFTGAGVTLPPELEHRVTRVDVAPPSREERWQYVLALLKDLRTRVTVEVSMSQEEARRLVDLLAGLTFFEINKILTRCMVETRRFDSATLERVRDAKADMLASAGALEYFPAGEEMSDVAGLDALKDWLDKRAALFRDPRHAIEFGLSAPRGLLLLGVQGCGKSLCAKAVASEWKLPLLRLDPGSMYNKYLGETEANLRRAIDTAEAMAPVVLWIDEIEKAFAGSGDDQGGTSRRVLGTFLQWMQDKKDAVFVVATANDISQLPPELLRKGRFDEIFFVDLPDAAARRDIFAVHLRRRKRNPDAFDLGELVRGSEGFSGAEIEQAVISALYSAFSDGAELTTEHIAKELAATQPLSVTMAEAIAALRAWAAERAVPAD